jgi:hypothetical protein
MNAYGGGPGGGGGGGYSESKNQRSEIPLSPNPPSLHVPPSHGTRRSFSTIDLTLATSQPPLPSPKRDYFQTRTVSSPSSATVTSSVAAAAFYLRSGYEIAHSCRFNAHLTQSLKLHSLYHIWTMLAVCFEMLSLAGMEYHPSPSAPQLLLNSSSVEEVAPREKKKIESCRRMVISGLSYDWSRHALGRPLLRKIFSSLSNLGDLQTLSTITCTLGGARATAYYLDETKLYTTQSLDRMLLRYADILHRWQCHVEATEVSKYISDDFSRNSSSSAALSSVGVEELSSHDLVSMKLEMQCLVCKKIIKAGNGNGNGCGAQWCKGCKQFTQKCGVCEQVCLSDLSSSSLILRRLFEVFLSFVRCVVTEGIPIISRDGSSRVVSAQLVVDVNVAKV